MAHDPAPVLSAETLALVRKSKGTCHRLDGIGCFLCKWILEALGPDHALRPWPPGAEGSAIVFSVDGQRRHILLEKGQPVEP
ncbi:MAG: hypothetical protein ACRDZ4_11535 [Egibacteraceae bacterium]